MNLNLNLVIVTAIAISLIVLIVYCIHSSYYVKEGNEDEAEYSQKELKRIRRKEEELRKFCMRKYNRILEERNSITRSADENVQHKQFDDELKKEEVKNLKDMLKQFEERRRNRRERRRNRRERRNERRNEREDIDY